MCVLVYSTNVYVCMSVLFVCTVQFMSLRTIDMLHVTYGHFCCSCHNYLYEM